LSQTLRPTILGDVPDDARILNEEAFGPAIAIRKFCTDEEAISFVNSAKYALGASIWTLDVDLAKKMAEQLDVGMVWVNEVNLPIAGGPWGGRRKSGNGVELAKQSFENFSQLKHICSVEPGGKNREWWFPYPT